MTYWSSMVHTAELLRGVLVPFLVIGGSLLGLLLGFLVVQRGIRALVCRRRDTLIARYRPLIDEITQSPPTPELLERLRRIPVRHRKVVAHLLLAPLHAARGDLVSHVRDAAVALGLVDRWLGDLQHRHWWVRADAARALGFVEARSAQPAIMHALDDAHAEVRAAAVEAVGRLGDLSAIPALLGHLADGSHYQRARVIDALRDLGPAVTPALVAFARAHPERARLAVDVLGLIGTAAASESLLEWCGDPRSDVRMAALTALGSIGLDDRSYYFALRALGDADPRARAMAARALGRGRREEAVSYLAERLDGGGAAPARRRGGRGARGAIPRRRPGGRPCAPDALVAAADLRACISELKTS